MKATESNAPKKSYKPIEFILDSDGKRTLTRIPLKKVPSLAATQNVLLRRNDPDKIAKTQFLTNNYSNKDVAEPGRGGSNQR